MSLPAISRVCAPKYELGSSPLDVDGVSKTWGGDLGPVVDETIRASGDGIRRRVFSGTRAI